MQTESLKACMTRKIIPQTRPPIWAVDQIGQHPLLDVMTARDNVRVIFCTYIPKSIKTEYTLKENWATCPVKLTV